jgi:hypothetical protein
MPIYKSEEDLLARLQAAWDDLQAAETKAQVIKVWHRHLGKLGHRHLGRMLVGRPPEEIVRFLRDRLSKRQGGEE